MMRRVNNSAISHLLCAIQKKCSLVKSKQKQIETHSKGFVAKEQRLS